MADTETGQSPNDGPPAKTSRAGRNLPAAIAVGAALGPRRHPYGLVFAALVAPRLGPVTDREPAAPLRFAQLGGLVFAMVGGFAFTTGLTLLGLVATGLALVAALLNAAFGICLGCLLYPLAVRLRLTPEAPSRT